MEVCVERCQTEINSRWGEGGTGIIPPPLRIRFKVGRRRVSIIHSCWQTPAIIQARPDTPARETSGAEKSETPRWEFIIYEIKIPVPFLKYSDCDQLFCCRPRVTLTLALIGAGKAREPWQDQKFIIAYENWTQNTNGKQAFGKKNI